MARIGDKWKLLVIAASFALTCSAPTEAVSQQCVQPPKMVLKDMKQISCHKQDEATCCGYLRNVNEARACVVVLCQNSCAEPFLLEDAGCFEKRDASMNRAL